MTTIEPPTQNLRNPNSQILKTSMLDKYVTIGFTKKAYGSRGQVKVVIHEQFVEDFARSGHVFIPLQGKPAPFFIENIDVVGDILLKIEDINSPEEAKSIVSKDLLLREQDLSGLPVEKTISDLEFVDVEGFLLTDLEIGEIGIIKEVQEFPQQEMAVVNFKDKDVFIPLHPDLIETIDEKGKKITLRLPRGILDL